MAQLVALVEGFRKLKVKKTQRKDWMQYYYIGNQEQYEIGQNEHDTSHLKTNKSAVLDLAAAVL